MRLHDMPPSLLCLIALISQTTRPAAAAVLPSEEPLQALDNTTLIEKRCANPCGYYGQLCCESSQYCYTDSNNQAQCGEGSDTTSVYTSAAGSTTGQWSVYTTTYVQTDLQTVTTTYSSFYPITSKSVTTTTLSCSASQGETPCGTCCCLTGQYCAAAGQCVAGSSFIGSSLQTITVTSSATAIVPLRPTSGTVVTITSTGSVTTTEPYQTPVGTDGSIITGTQASTQSHGLSGGAIAGIVIGVIVGIILLILICACCCVKSLWDGLLAILGIRRSGHRRTEETYIEERRSSDRRSNHGGWFKNRPGRGNRTEVIEEKNRVGAKKAGGWGGVLGVGAALGGLALLLGLKRSSNRRREEDKSTVSYDSYYSTEYTSSSSESSDRRTRQSRSRSRASRSRR